MRATLKCIGLVCLMAASPVWAQSSGESDVMTRVVDVPTYPKFMDACIGSFVDNSDQPGVMPDDKKLLAYSLLCQCTFDEIAPLGQFGVHQYAQSVEGCMTRAKSDPAKFAQDFAGKTYENVKKYAEQDNQE